MNTITRSNLCRSILISSLVITLSGCVVIPIPMPSKTQASYFDRDDVAFIKQGKTSQEEIRELLGDPSHTYENPSKWVYTMHRYTENRWAVCIVIGGPGYADGDCGMASEGKTKYKFLD